MGSQQGFTGAYVTLCAIMLAVTKRLQPLCLVHECTRLFPFSVFETVLTNHVDHHMILECQNFGAPVKRGRAYDVIVRKDHILVGGLDSLWRLARRCTLDASVWLQASDAEVKEYQKHLAGIALRGNNTCFDELLPAAAQANLAKVKEMTWVQSAMANGKEVAANLDQDPAVMEHVGVLMPVILASISHMWATRANRPFLPQELLVAQVIPVFEHLWRSAGFEKAPIDFSGTSYTAMSGLQKMQESAVGDKTLCINCDLRISDTDAANRSGWEGMDWSTYVVYFTSPKRGEDRLSDSEALRAWMRDLQGNNGVESYKAEVLNRKSGKMELRDHVWVHKKHFRSKTDTDETSRSVTKKKIAKDPTEVQVQEASLKVAAFVTHDMDSEFIMSAKLHNFQADSTVFLEGGSGQSVVERAKTGGGKKKDGKNAAGGKLVDVSQLRSRFVIKVSAMAKFTTTALKEALKMHSEWAANELDFVSTFERRLPLSVARGCA
ncbi:unnamed protein product [Effrenium voratum]|nr:unnamed protein product [Effrenium voratum]